MIESSQVMSHLSVRKITILNEILKTRVQFVVSGLMERKKIITILLVLLNFYNYIRSHGNKLNFAPIQVHTDFRDKNPLT